MSELDKKFGELLRLERKRKGRKLEELSDQLKISEINLEYIEEGQVSSLPSRIYYNLFARAYAESLGIDYERTIEAIKEDLGEAAENGEAEPSVPRAGKKAAKTADRPEPQDDANGNSQSLKKLLYFFGGIVVVFVVFLLVYLVFFASEDEQTGEPPTVTQPSETPDTISPSTAASEPGSELEWNVSNYQEPQKMTLRLIPRNESWSTVVADGDTVIFRNLMPGRIYEAEAMYRLTVSIGIPSQVEVELNGRSVNLRNRESGRISRVEINQLNLAEYTELQQEDSAEDRPDQLPQDVPDSGIYKVSTPGGTPGDTATVHRDSSDET
jgi:cytoskeletal protein RodZ